MADTTNIQWCDSTFNPWFGCTKVGPGCDHCYAETLMASRYGKVEWGAGKPRVRTAPANWRKPAQWNREPFVECAGCGWRGVCHSPGDCPACGATKARPARRRVFCASLADVFDNDVDPTWRYALLDLILSTPNLDWLLLTKRIGNVRTMLAGWFRDNWPAHVWIGATVVNQDEAERDIPKLLDIPAHVRFLSIEPMLGPVDLSQWLGALDRRAAGLSDDPLAAALMQQAMDEGCGFAPVSIHWVIAGGESGLGARPLSIHWVRELRDQCVSARVAFHWKQWGEWSPAGSHPSETPGHFAFGDYEHDRKAMITTDHYPRQFTMFGARSVMERKGKKKSGRELDGRTHDGFPSPC